MKMMFGRADELGSLAAHSGNAAAKTETQQVKSSLEIMRDNCPQAVPRKLARQRQPRAAG
jgi:hypothetical protein